MLNKVIELSLKYRFVVLLAGVLLIVSGTYALTRLPLDAFPDTTPVQVQINTVAPALGPEEVEQQITLPVELAIGGLPGLHEVRSISKFGLSQVTATFEDKVDVYFARQLVHQRLQDIELSQEFRRPRMGPAATGLGEIYHYLLSRPTPAGMTSEENLTELRTVQDWVLKPQLRSVPGVAELNSWGGFEKQYQVEVDPSRLLKHGLTLSEIQEALKRNNLNVGGGTLVESGEAQLLKGVGILTTTSQI